MYSSYHGNWIRMLCWVQSFWCKAITESTEQILVPLCQPGCVLNSHQMTIFKKGPDLQQNPFYWDVLVVIFNEMANKL